MKTTQQISGALAFSALFGTALLMSNTTAFGAIYMTPAGASTANGSVDATGSVVVGNGTVTVVLTDLTENPISSGQTLSGIEFTVSGETSAATLASSSGDTSTINPDGTYTPGAYASHLGHWGAASDVNLSAINLVGHMPYDLIIGPDNAGGFSNAGTYSHANGGLANFDPYVLGTATFTLNVPGVTSSSTITGVAFEFGTNPDAVDAAVTTAVPEPGNYGISACALALMPLGAGLLRRITRQAPTSL